MSKWERIILYVGGLTVIGILAWGEKNTPANSAGSLGLQSGGILEIQGLQIVDSNGKDLAWIGPSRQNGHGLAIYDAKGRTRVWLAPTIQPGEAKLGIQFRRDSLELLMRKITG